MRRIIDDNIAYIQDGYEFNMYYLNPIDRELFYQLIIEKTDDYDIKCMEFNLSNISNCFSFIIEEDNLFYSGFCDFLKDSKEVLIKDDLGFHQYGKIFVARKVESGIQLSFEYENRNDLNEFGVHVLGCGYDGRSIIDQEGKDTKERLFELCDTLFSTFSQYEESYDGLALKKNYR